MNTRLVESLIQIIQSLSVEERTLLETKLRLPHSANLNNQQNWREDPFIGLWKDREDMQDSSQWVRTTRQREWLS